MKYLVLPVALFLTACGGGYTPPANNSGPVVETPVEPEFVCPEGMPTYKCEQLKEGNK